MSPLIQTLSPAYYSDIERQLKRIFYEIIFAPTLKIVKASTAQRPIENAGDEALRSALQSGRIQYSNGIFSGEFSARISRALRGIGAKFAKGSKTYRISPLDVPGWVTAESVAYAMKAKSAHEEIIRALNETKSHLESIVSEYPVDASQSIDAIAHGFRQAAKKINVSPKLSPESKAELKAEYTKNMSIWIEDFTQKEIIALRQRVEKNALDGYRFDSLISGIKGRMSVSDNKAKFLARQETSLFLAKFREKRFKDGGITRYRWSTAHDERVRHSHSELNGQVFSYDNPPITTTIGDKVRRNNPGQDYNCRCVDIPVLEVLDR